MGVRWYRSGFQHRARPPLSNHSQPSKEESPTPHRRFSSEQIYERGEKIYAEILRSQVETEENIGKIISIDIETGDYEFSEAGDLLTGAMRLQAKHPTAAIYGKRIGFNAVIGVGGSTYRVI
jgi:hypothetical protein